MIPTVATHLPRLLHPLLPSCAWRRPGDARNLYLTFDDGPSRQTETLLNLLDRYDAKVTFFLLGEQCERYPDVAREMVRRGHVVGCHGYTHLDAWRARRSQVLQDFIHGCEVLETIVDSRMRWIRPPYGHLRPALVRWARATKREVVLWDVMPGDYLPGADARTIAAFVERMSVPGSIVVLHDNQRCLPLTLQALGTLLPGLRAADWQLRALGAVDQDSTTA